MKILIVLILFFTISLSFTKDNETQFSKFDSGSIKLIPTFFGNTYGLQAEYSIGFKFGVGLNAFYYGGHPKHQKIIVAQQQFHSENLSYNEFLYFDGNNRPYATHNHWGKFKNFSNQKNLSTPSALSGGLGYQVKFMRHLVGDVMINVQGQVDNSGIPYFSTHCLPSVGYVLNKC